MAQSTDPLQMLSHGSDDGFYLSLMDMTRGSEDRTELMGYIDYAQARAAVLCAQPNCTHSDESCPAWRGIWGGSAWVLPDGEHIVTNTGDEDSYTLTLCKPDGTVEKTLCRTADNNVPTLADSTWLYCVVAPGGSIVRVPLAGGDPEPLTSLNAYDVEGCLGREVLYPSYGSEEQADGTSRLSTLDGQKLSTFFGQSSFATYAVVNQRNAVKVEYDDIDLSVVAPIGCGIQTGAGAVLNRLRPEFGSSIAVFGCGTVGMSAIMAAKIAGCEKIIAVGGNPKSLELAKELGATHTINRKEVDDIVGTIRNEITDGGVNYAIDTSGVPDFVKKALAACRFMGTAVVLGATGDVTFNIQAELMGDAKSLIGIVEGDSIPKLFIPKLLDYYKKGMFPFDKLIRFYPFEQINEAFEASHSGECIKAVLKMS